VVINPGFSNFRKLHARSLLPINGSGDGEGAGAPPPVARDQIFQMMTNPERNEKFECGGENSQILEHKEISGDFIPHL